MYGQKGAGAVELTVFEDVADSGWQLKDLWVFDIELVQELSKDPMAKLWRWILFIDEL